MLGLQHFGDPQLERIYRKQLFAQNVPLLINVFCVFVVALVALATNHLLWKPDLVLVLAILSASFALALGFSLYLGSNAKKKSSVLGTALWLCLSVATTLPAGSQFALLPTIIAYFIFYTIFPFDVFWTVGAAMSLSVAQIISFVSIPTYPFSVDQVLATLLVHIWSNFIGIYLFSTRNRLCRATFLNARSAVASQQETVEENRRMGTLLSSALPPHVIATVQDQIGLNVPKLYVEHYGNVTVFYGKLVGVEQILSQISVQDAVRLLNEFNNRIDHLAQAYNLVRVQSNAIVVVSGTPQFREDHANIACQFASDLSQIVRTFCEATTAELTVKGGIASGSISCGIIGARKWHYDIIGTAIDIAKELESVADNGAILLSDETKRRVQSDFSTKLNSKSQWQIVPSLALGSVVPNSLLFPTQRRFSLMTVPQAVNRLLQSAVTNASESKGNAQGRRKKKLSESSCEKLDEVSTFNTDEDVLKFWSLRFKEGEVEEAYNLQMDRWFIPALAICIFFLVVYGIYQVLVMPRLITTLALIICALAVMFVILLMLYVNYFESFCQFVTRTAAGHSIAILLILVLLYTCGIVNTFSCPSLSSGVVCQVVHYSTMSCVLWMLTTAVFIRFSSLYLIGILFAAISFYSLHIFGTHSELYENYAAVMGWRVQIDLLIGLLTLASLIYLQSRRNERMIRMDYLAVLRAMEERRKMERIEFINEQILMNALPSHIAYNYLLRTDPYSHLCHTVGVISADFGTPLDWQGETGFNRLNKLIYELDRLVETFTGLEKVRSSHSTYCAAVGVLPEISKNIHDTPSTIGDLLAALTQFAISIRKMAFNEGLQVAIGIDCGAALSAVVGNDRPRYEVVGNPCVRSEFLMRHANDQRILVSEEIYLALRPRNFRFHRIARDIGIAAYALADGNEPINTTVPLKDRKFMMNVNPADSDGDATSDDLKLEDETTQSTTCPISTEFNNFNNGSNMDIATSSNQGILAMFAASMNSSFSSELCSIDVSCETDSEMEWITPNMMASSRDAVEGWLPRDRPYNSQALQTTQAAPIRPPRQPFTYKGDRARQYSDFSEAENPLRGSASARVRRKKFRPSLSRNGPKLPSWLSSRTSFTSQASIPPSLEGGSSCALDRLNAAARRVDRMLHELASVDSYANDAEVPFPTNLPNAYSASVHSVDSKREMSSACNTEYDNADSDGACSDSEMLTHSRLEKLKQALKNVGGGKENDRNRRFKLDEVSTSAMNRRRRLDNGNEADVDSNCSSLASSVMFDRLKWKSVHSIGYENEYELVSEMEDSSIGGAEEPFLGDSVGANTNFAAMDADSEVELKNDEEHLPIIELSKISEDIRKKFGDYQLASFSDLDV